MEIDTIIGANHRGAIVSIVDRASKLTRLVLLPSRKTRTVTRAILHALTPLAHLLKTITTDNGKEFSLHEIIAAKLKTSMYFAKPYASGRRGLNEHTNGLVREYLPKGTNFRNVTQATAQKIETMLNQKPRKSLNFTNTPGALHRTRR